MFETIQQAFDITGGSPTDCENDGPARRTRLAIVAMLAAGIFAALFGLAVGSTDTALAIGNVIKVPLALLLSSVFAIPATLLTLKLTGRPISYTNFIVSQSAALFTGALVLAAGAPVAGLFYHTSTSVGPWFSMGIAHAAVLIGFFVLVRGVVTRREEGTSKTALLIPVGIFSALQVIALIQLISLASPILPEVTPYTMGADGLVSSVE